jgi:hypothetical protein
MAATLKTVPNRSCRYCKAKFKPVREDQRFCKPAHRKAFWKYGGLPFDKMKEQIIKDVRKMVRAEFAAMQPAQPGSDSTPLRQIVREELGRYRLTIDDRASQ